jgi:hypothetical protein
MSEPIGFLKDANGDNSSKRLWGSISMVLGLAMKVSISIIALTSLIPVAEVATRLPMALGAADGVLMAGAALLGIGVVEGFQPKVV